MLTAIDLFCGAGGLSEGFRQAGFHILAGNDFDECAGRTFAVTHPEAAFLPGPIQDITPKDFLGADGLKAGELDCLIGGPPCQAFSVYNHQRGMHDKRSVLFREYLRIVKGLKPKWIVMENVTGILSISDGDPVQAIKDGLADLGYYVETKVLKAEEYGVPQERRRVFFIGNRMGLPICWPDADHGPGLKPFTTVWDALSDLPVLKNGEDTGDTLYACEAKSDYQKMLRKGSKKIINHSAPRLSDINLQRMKHIPEGGSWRDIPMSLLPEGMKKAKRSDHTKRYGRLKKKGLSSTILTKCDIHWGAYIHPTQDRSLTVREAARLQSFPDWFKFEGPKTEQYIQVGNAVPPLLGRKVAKALLSAMNIVKSSHSSSKSRVEKQGEYRYYHHHWKTKIVAVIQEQVYNYIKKEADFMCSKDVKNPNVNIIFMTYAFDHDPERPGQYKPILKTVEGTSHSNLQNAILYKNAPSRNEFCKQISRSLGRSNDLFSED